MYKDPITLDELIAMGMPPIIQYAAPMLFFFVFVEYWLTRKTRKDLYDGKDSLAASVIGIVNVIISALIRLALFEFVLIFYNLVPWQIPNTWWSFPLCLISIDFCRYWAHRIAHVNRFFWATHVTHHSSKKLNLTVSFRLSWVQFVKVIFFVPVALAGFHPITFFICHQISVLYQFWIHTELIRKLPPFIEYIFVTPSHHRVHHGKNPKYLDKNFGSTFIIWDRMFGTFQPEEERPEYGITKEVNSYNPVTLVFHEFRDIINDVRKASNFKEAWSMIFGKPR